MRGALKGHQVNGRDREKDLHVLAGEFFKNLRRDDYAGAWTLDLKRPFGDSDVNRSIAAILGLAEPYDGYELRDDVTAYVEALHADLGDYLRSWWSRQ